MSIEKKNHHHIQIQRKKITFSHFFVTKIDESLKQVDLGKNLSLYPDSA